MQIKIEIDVKPEELRRFLGLPDVAGLQEELIAFLRDKVAEANVDPAGFVRANLATLRNSRAWRRIMEGAAAAEADAEAAPKKKPAARKRARRAGSGQR